MKLTSLWMCAVFSLGLTACDAGTNTRLGDEGERCFSDEDCRGGLLCDDNLCQSEGGDPNPDPNPDSPLTCGDGLCGPGESDANCPEDCGAVDLLSCEDVCESLADCIDDGGIPECTFGCEEDTEELPQDVQQRLFSCLLDMTCEELIDGGGEDCFEGRDDGGDEGPGVSPSPDPGPPEPGGEFRFVLIDDGRVEPGENPGADIDAISILKGDGREIFAQSVEDASVSERGNNAPDVSELLGPPDAMCQVRNITSLNGGFAIVSFGRESFSIGDAINVYELGETECGTFDDDGYTVSISDNFGVFIQIGTGLGSQSFPVDF